MSDSQQQYALWLESAPPAWSRVIRDPLPRRPVGFALHRAPAFRLPPGNRRLGSFALDAHVVRRYPP